MRFGLQNATRRSARHDSTSSRRKTRRSGLFGRRLSVEPLEERCLLSIGPWPELPGMRSVAATPENLQGQVIYLDFDGAKGVDYNGPVAVKNIDVPAFQAPGNLAGQEQLIAAGALEHLQRVFSDVGVVFKLDTPATGAPHSVIYVGGDSSPFASYGVFRGLAEQVDVGNRNPNDQAFVFANTINADELDTYINDLAATIVHETGHLLGYAHDHPTTVIDSPLAAVADTKSGSNSTDAAFTTANTWKYTPVSISGAPSNAVISSVSLSWNVDSNWTSDLRWYLENFGYWNSSTSATMSQTGDDWFDGYNETSAQTVTLYPSSTCPVNGTWYFNLKDAVNDGGGTYDSGRIDSWSITINYTVFTPTFWNASLEGVTDADGDGKYRTLKVGFDVDSNIAGQFYVKVYDNDTLTFDDLITTSPNYAVNGSASDWHYLTFDVNSSWFEWASLDTADIYLELWNANTGAYVSTWNLGTIGAEMPADDIPFAPYFFNTQLSNKVDQDGDGYNRSLTVETDIDSNISGPVYYEVWEVAGNRKLATSATFTVNGTATDYQPVNINADTHSLPHGTYDFMLKLYKSSGTLVQTWTKSNDADLGGIRMETAADDTFTPYFSSTNLTGVTDNDGDLKYQTLQVGFDVDSNIAGQFYVEVWDYDTLTGDDYITISPTYSVNGIPSDWHYVTFGVNSSWFEWSSLDTADIYLKLFNANTGAYVSTRSLGTIGAEMPADDVGVRWEDSSRAPLDLSSRYAIGTLVYIGVFGNSGTNASVSLYEDDGIFADDFIKTLTVPLDASGRGVIPWSIESHADTDGWDILPEYVLKYAGVESGVLTVRDDGNPGPHPNATLVGGVPAYEWYYGCTPTAFGMIVGYWDSNGYGNLVPGDASSQTQAVKDSIASAAHITAGAENRPTSGDGTYDGYGDWHNSSSYPNHETNPDCIADFIKTVDGGTYTSNYVTGMTGFLHFRGYDDWNISQETWGALTWSDLTSAIDAGHPLEFDIDSDGDGSADHAIAVIGYDATTHEYATLNTWSATKTAWYTFGAVTNGTRYGVEGATYLVPNSSPILSGIPDKTLNEDGSLNNAIDLWAYASDQETPDSGLSFSIIGNTNTNCGVSIDSNRYIDIAPLLNWYGTSDVTIQVSDGHLTASDTFRITVNAVNDKPTAQIISISPNPAQPPSQMVNFNGSSNDIDGTVVAWEWTSNLDGLLSTSEDWSTSSNNLTVATHQISFCVKDNSGAWSDSVIGQSIINNATPTADPPGVPGSSVAPGSTFTTTLSGHDNDENQQSIVAGRLFLDGLLLANAMPGTYLVTAPTGLGVHSLAYQVQDDEGTWSGQVAADFTVSATNRPPVVNDQTLGPIAENSPNGTLAGVVVASDPDTGQTLTFAITAGNTNNAFSIDNAGQIRVANVAALNFETTPTFALTVQATDNGSPPLSDPGTVTINLTDVNDQPTDISLSNTSVAENQALGAVVGVLSGADPDAGQGATLTFSLVSGYGDNARFSIDPATKQLKTAAVFDYETRNNYSIKVQATDTGNLSYDELFTISVTNVNDASVAGRYLFYNNSSFDGDDPEANAPDDYAIAPDKQALLPGAGKAAFKNYTSSSRGLNGIMVDVAGLPADTLAAADFAFTYGNDDTPGDWLAAADPTTIAVRAGAGAGGSDRVTLIWADNAIPNGNWLRVMVKANEHTGLAAEEIFYFGSAVGETGNSLTDAKVNSQDVIRIRNNYTGFGTAGIESVYDFNRDGKVNSQDVTLCRNRYSGFTPLVLITPAASMPPPPAAAVQAAADPLLWNPAWSIDLTWLDATERAKSKSKVSGGQQEADRAVDWALAAYAG